MKKDTTAAVTENLQETLPDLHLKPVVTEIGEVVYVGDGICKIKGLPSAHIDDVVEIDTSAGTIEALILGISPEQIEAAVLGDFTRIRQGDVVRSTNTALTIQAGDQVLGRVINPLGEPLDGLGPLKGQTRENVERPAPGVAKRQPVTQPLETGVLVVDATIPLGKGQRELVIGDRKSGKTELLTNFIVNQAGKKVICVYVAIGAQKARVRSIEEKLKRTGAMDYTCMVVGSSDDPPSLNYLAPYVGRAIGEHFAYLGKDVLVIYDDLSKHAKAYRQMSLLLKRSPGRDAYPGDIFYLHSRLLERAYRLTEKLKGGSLTALPVAETQNGDVSEYICTNLMSITDGHIYLDINLMHEGIFPPVNSGTSVSRIGGSVQTKAMRKMSEPASTQMARYAEVKSFEVLNTEVSEETEREIKRGKRILEVFAQDNEVSLKNDEMVLLLFLATSGMVDDIESPDLRKLKGELITFYRSKSFPEFQKACIEESDPAKIEPEVRKVVAEFLPNSQVESAKLILEDKEEEEKPLPIIPDPAQASAEPAKEPAKQ